MKIFILTHCAAGENYTPQKFRTQAEAQKQMEREIDETLFERDIDGEVIDQRDYDYYEVYTNYAEIVWEEDVYDIYQIFEIEINLINPLDEFCANEAPFRLQEIFGKSDDFIKGKPDVVEDVAGIIRHTIDYCEVLYDVIDDNIREYLEKNNLLENED